jgi:hypothetical protein
MEEQSGTFYITGLTDNASYRTNIGFANAGDTYASGIKVTMLDKFGDVLGHPYEFGIYKHNTIQILNLLQKCGVDEDVDLFTLKVETGIYKVVAYASKIDNISTDPTLNTTYELGDSTVYVPGVAHLEGVNDSLWLSDVTLFNPTDTTSVTRIDVIFQEDPGYQPYIELTLPPLAAESFVDVLAPFILDSSKGGKGYLKITGIDGSVPMISARTYNQTLSNGTLGQALIPYGESLLITASTSGFIPGLTNSSSSTSGFRTNMGLVNTSSEASATIDVTLYDETGASAGFKRFELSAGEFRQFNVFDEMSLGSLDLETSAEIAVKSGGPVAAYISSVDNGTGDSVFIPALYDTISKVAR